MLTACAGTETLMVLIPLDEKYPVLLVSEHLASIVKKFKCFKLDKETEAIP